MRSGVPVAGSHPHPPTSHPPLAHSYPRPAHPSKNSGANDRIIGYEKEKRDEYPYSHGDSSVDFVARNKRWESRTSGATHSLCRDKKNGSKAI